MWIRASNTSSSSIRYWILDLLVPSYIIKIKRWVLFLHSTETRRRHIDFRSWILFLDVWIIAVFICKLIRLELRSSIVRGAVDRYFRKSLIRAFVGSSILLLSLGRQLGMVLMMIRRRQGKLIRIPKNGAIWFLGEVGSKVRLAVWLSELLCWA